MDDLSIFIERFVQSIKQECVDYFHVIGTAHIDCLCREYLTYYHAEGPTKVATTNRTFAQ